MLISDCPKSDADVGESSDPEGFDSETDWHTDENSDDENEAEDGKKSTLPPLYPPKEADYQVDPATWSYPDGLPINPLLALALVSRPFLYAVRRCLYGSDLISLRSAYQTSLIVRTLTSPEVVADDSGRTIAQLIEGVEIGINSQGGASLGRGGLGLAAQVIEACPRLKSIYLKVNALHSVWPALEKALSKAVLLERVALSSGTDDVSLQQLYAISHER